MSENQGIQYKILFVDLVVVVFVVVVVVVGFMLA